MESVEFTHVAVVATDLQQSVDWYSDIFGADVIVRVPSPKFIGPAVWLKLGHQSLHLAQWPERSKLRVNHFGVGVLDPDLFHSIYRKASEQNIFDRSFGSNIWEIPSGEVQMYLLDPSDNIVEVDFPDVTLLNRSIIRDLPRLADAYQPQPDRAAQGTLFPWLRELHAQEEAGA